MHLLNKKKIGTMLITTAATLCLSSSICMADELTNICGTAKAVEDNLGSNTQFNLIDKVGDVPTEVANKLGCEVSEDDTYHLIFGEELASYGIILKSDKTSEELADYEKNVCLISDIKLTNTDIVDISGSVIDKNNNIQVLEDTTKSNSLLVDLVADTLKEVEDQETKNKRSGRAIVNTNVDQTGALFEIEYADANYRNAIVTLTPEDRDLLERLVMGEAGGSGFEGAALVAQAIRDTMVYKGFGSVAEVRKACGYYGSIKKTPNQDTLDAVRFIFDEGGMAVKHPIFYFYAYRSCTSSFHESQKFIIQHGGHRYFSTWNY